MPVGSLTQRAHFEACGRSRGGEGAAWDQELVVPALAYWRQVTSLPVADLFFPRALSLPLRVSWPAGGSRDAVSHFTPECPPPHLTYSPNWQSRVPTPGEMLSPLLCTYPCCVGIADVCRCVRVCCRTGFAVPFSQAGVCCSAVVLFRVTDLGGGRGETLSNGGVGGGG